MEKIIIESQLEFDALPSKFDEPTRIIIKSKSRIIIRTARGNSSVEAWGNSSVVAWENSSVVAWGNSSVELFDFSIAHLKSTNASISIVSTKATVIKVDYPCDVGGWCALKGIKIQSDNTIHTWKCVDKNGYDFYTGKILYDSEMEIICPDWDLNLKRECGGGLHLADSPSSARAFVSNDKLKTARLFLVSAKIEDCICVGGLPDYPNKIRARACMKIKEYPIDYKEWRE